MYCPIGDATTISPTFSPEIRSITLPCPPKMPRIGKVTAVVMPLPRTVSMRLSVAEISSAATAQLVVCGRSSGPMARGAGAAAGVAVSGGVLPAPSAAPAMWPPRAPRRACPPCSRRRSARDIRSCLRLRSPRRRPALAHSRRHRVMSPLWITTVPLLMTGPDTGTIFALRIATVTGPSAMAYAQNRSNAVTSFFIRVMLRIIYASSNSGDRRGTG